MEKGKIILIVVLTIVALLGCGTAVFFLAAPSHEQIIMIGHRGYSSKYLQNTKQAFEEASKHGSKGVETDVRYTKDGVYVLSHDSEAVFADGTSLVVSESTYAELIAKPLKNNKTKDENYICTLKEYLEVCKANNMICFIELKGNYNTQQIKEVFEYIQQYYSLEMCELQTSHFDVLIEAQKLFPNLNFMLTWDESDGDYTRCFEYGFDIDAKYSDMTKEMVQEFHDRGLKVAAWTCNDPFALYYCYWFGVDYIESDVY